jgi:hypothetical protein
MRDIASRAGWLAIGLAGLVVAGSGLHATHVTVPADLAVTDPPACGSCAARHARLADLRAGQAEATE